MGELEQWDSSVHAWLEDRAAGDQVLISIHDDATCRLIMARFVERDDGAENRRAIIGYLRRHGRPLAAYTDHAGHFGQWLSRRGERTDTIISRAHRMSSKATSRRGTNAVPSPAASTPNAALNRGQYAPRCSFASPISVIPARANSLGSRP